MSQSQHEIEVMRELYDQEQEAEQALPPHKRTGYYEQMCDYADLLRDRAKDEAIEKSIEGNENGNS